VAIFLAVAGNIGSGKTTLTSRLASRLGFRALFESTAQNPYLEDFYRDMPRYALALQLRFLGLRVRDTRAVQRADIGAVQDRTCYEDAEIFAANLHARGEMDARDYETYRLLAEELLRDLEPPDLLVYLARSPASCSTLIDRRGRAYERAMPREYLEDLGRRYDAWFAGYERGPKLRIEADEFDFVERERDLEAIVDRIRDSLPQRFLPFGP
jgi:deoxyadenosine/deoxycytidine kinase